VQTPNLKTDHHCSVLMVFTMPIAIDSLGWKLYMINGAWDVIVLALVWIFWVETSGKTLEELDEVLDGVKHTDVPDLEKIYQGKEGLREEVAEAVRTKSVGH